MPRESSLRDQIRDLIVRDIGGFVTNHEDKFQRGIPDTSFCWNNVRHDVPGHYLSEYTSGWLELKNHHSWPKMWLTELRLGLRPEQRIWIRDRWKHGRDVWVIIRIAENVYMFRGADVDALYFPITRDHFERLWIGKWEYRIDKREFVELVCASQ